MKIILILLLISGNLLSSQNIEFKYRVEVCYESKLLEEYIYDSKSSIYEEVNYDRNSFVDTANIYKESFKAYIPLDSIQRKKIISKFYNLKINKNILFDANFQQTDYRKTSLFFYKDGKLINGDDKYLTLKNDVENFNNLVDEISSLIKSSKEYNRVFYWYGEKR